MNSKKLFFITGLALLVTVFLTIAAFRLADPIKKPNITPNTLPKSDISQLDIPSEEEVKEELYLSKKGEKLISKDLVKPLSKKFGLEVSLNQFSRCPSGVQYYQITSPSEQTPYFFMQLTHQDGCMPIDLCQFRVSLDQENIEVWNEENEKYISTKEYVANMTAEEFNYRMDLEEEELQIKESPSQKTL
jgi:hypothetical protein